MTYKKRYKIEAICDTELSKNQIIAIITALGFGNIKMEDTKEL